MEKFNHLEAIDRKILEIISHYGNLNLLDLWYELGECDDLKEIPVTEEEVVNRLWFLQDQGVVECSKVSKEDIWWALKK